MSAGNQTWVDQRVANAFNLWGTFLPLLAGLCVCWSRVQQFGMLPQFEQGRNWGSAHSYCFRLYNLWRMRSIGRAWVLRTVHVYQQSVFRWVAGLGGEGLEFVVSWLLLGWREYVSHHSLGFLCTCLVSSLPNHLCPSLLLSLLIIGARVCSCSPGWPGIYIDSPASSECWDYTHLPVYSLSETRSPFYIFPLLCIRRGFSLLWCPCESMCACMVKCNSYFSGNRNIIPAVYGPFPGSFSIHLYAEVYLFFSNTPSSVMFLPCFE